MHDASNTECPLHALAASPVGNVSLCPGCGVVHVTLQYVTVRLEPGAFSQFVHMLARANIALLRQQASPDEPAVKALHH